ncbi:family 43 glycosylhydrolase [Konateibacter massiliensis]|uniref:family 43 glycosylhydrolase n=1 Tax=Konateibacter massiliensis TaxID=2002841 RepID=UPI001F15C71C|nr:family 43 glycosylhydrolase [Konateibacter massiliensis]
MNKMLFPSAPLFRDPIYDGPTDPVIIYNHEEECYWMLYTQRRSTAVNIGVSHIHGTLIGVASSKNLVDWVYRGTLPNLEFEPGTNTFWAPEIIYENGTYHMYVSYVPGIPTSWNYTRHILHYTAKNMWDWKFESKLNLSSNRVIDACIYEVEKGLFKMWYKDEVHDSHTYSAVSRNLYDWEVVGAEITDVPHEGPNVFTLDGRHFMITDFWNGLGVYETTDFSNWTRRADILNTAGSRKDDGEIAHHADVVVNGKGDEAFIFYFVHPDYNPSNMPKDFEMTYKEARTVVQVARLTVEGDNLVCNRDEEFELVL